MKIYRSFKQQLADASPTEREVIKKRMSLFLKRLHRGYRV